MGSSPNQPGGSSRNPFNSFLSAPDKARMAGDRLTQAAPGDVPTPVAPKPPIKLNIKYKPEQPSAVPNSKYLSQSSSTPTGING